MKVNIFAGLQLPFTSRRQEHSGWYDWETSPYDALLDDYEPGNVKGETWDMSAKDFDERFDAGASVGATVVDYLNFHISCFDNLGTSTARELARPSVEYIRRFVKQIELEVDQGKLHERED